MTERIVSAGETVVQALSAVSSLLVVQNETRGTDAATYDCRGCLLVAIDCSRSVRDLGLAAMLEHLDRHVAADHVPGAKDAIGKLERCYACRGSGMQDFKTKCADCSATGKNELGRKRAKEREVRRGVVVP